MHPEYKYNYISDLFVAQIMKEQPRKKRFAFYSAKAARQNGYTNFYLNDKGQPIEVTIACEDANFIENLYWDDLVYKGIVYEWVAHVSN